jgi:hypothetical protein
MREKGKLAPRSRFGIIKVEGEKLKAKYSAQDVEHHGE